MANAVIEECAKVIEAAYSKTHAWKTGYLHQDDVKAGRLAAIKDLLAEIRSLKSPEKPV